MGRTNRKDSVFLPCAGTEISAAKSDIERDRVVMVKGFATIDNVALINVEGTGMVGRRSKCNT